MLSGRKVMGGGGICTLGQHSFRLWPIQLLQRKKHTRKRDKEWDRCSLYSPLFLSPYPPADQTRRTAAPGKAGCAGEELVEWPPDPGGRTATSPGEDRRQTVPGSSPRRPCHVIFRRSLMVRNL